MGRKLETPARSGQETGGLRFRLRNWKQALRSRTYLTLLAVFFGGAFLWSIAGGATEVTPGAGGVVRTFRWFSPLT